MIGFELHLIHLRASREMLQAEHERLRAERARLHRELVRVQQRRIELENFLNWIMLLSGVSLVVWTGRALACFWRWAWRKDAIEVTFLSLLSWQMARDVLDLPFGDISWKRYAVGLLLYLPLAWAVTFYRRLRVKTDQPHLSARIRNDS